MVVTKSQAFHGAGRRPRVAALASLLTLAATGAFAQFPEQPVLTPPPAPPAAARRVVKPAPKPRPAPKPGEVETAPIKCWWKTDTTEVRVGQRFTLTLTCGVIETSRLKVAANVNALDPGALQLTPFEVAGGVRRDDILSPPWRYFQYQYQVRLLSEGFFGQDVTLPSVSVTYNIQAAAGDGAQGRDLTYALPALPMRVASLVPRGAADIRDVAAGGFQTIAARQFRSSMATVAGAIMVSFAALFAVAALARAFGRLRGRRRVVTRPLSAPAILSGCLGALADIKASVSREGWSPALVRRALAAVRVASAVGMGRPLAEAEATPDTAVRDGQLEVRRGWIRRRRMLVSASTTGGDLERTLTENRVALRRVRGALETFRGALHTFNVAAYGRDGEAFDGVALDRALADSADAARQLRRRSLLPFGAMPASPAAVPRLASASMTGNRA